MTLSRRAQGVSAISALALLAGASVWLLTALAVSPEPPKHGDWLEAALFIKAEFQPGDVIRLEPFWLTSGRIYFGDLDGGTREPFRILDFHRTLDVPWLMAHSRVWVVASVETRGEAWEEQFPLAELLGRWDFEALSVTLLGMPDEAIAFNMVRDLLGVQVFRENFGALKPCKLGSGSGVFKCGDSGRLDVKVETREVGGGPRRCLLVRPGADELTTQLSVELPPESGNFFLRFGNTVEAGRQKEGGTVSVWVEQDGELLQDVELIRTDYDVHEIVASTQGGEVSNVSVTLWTADDRKREVCFDGYFVRSPWCDGEQESLCRQRP